MSIPAKFRSIYLAILSGLLLVLAWPEIGDQTYLIFVAWVPLLLIPDLSKEYHPWHGFGHGFITFLIWNLGCTWWIYNASAGGSAMAILGNTFLMAMVYYFVILVRNWTDRRKGLMAFVFAWMAWEYGHLHWDLTWTWLNLGNIFSAHTDWVQWYEYTGVPGGSLWVLIMNLVFLNIALRLIKKQPFQAVRPAVLFGALALAAPLIMSMYIKSGLEDSNEQIEVVVVQPNIDPYRDKFGGMKPRDQLEKLLQLADEKVTENTKIIFGPETALPPIWTDKLERHHLVQRIESHLDSSPAESMVIGLSARKLYRTSERPSAVARPVNDINGWYEAYNSALFLDGRKQYPIYHKSKLVVGVEKMPFPFIFKHFEKLAINLGGTTGSLGTQEKRENFTTADQLVTVAPIICFESIFGEFVGEYVTEGANLLSIITNDGWWDDTPGHRQHLLFAKLRAIETRRNIARSANTGISGFINYKGEITQHTEWWEPDALRGQVGLRDEITVYAQYGDYLSRLSTLLFVLLFLSSLAGNYKRKYATQAA